MRSFAALVLGALSLAPRAISLGTSCSAALGSGTAASSDPFWYQNINHDGSAPYASSGYSVYRNVKDYGAKGDGSTDDTAAINSAITAGSRCGNGCASSTLTPAVVYFPSGTYVVSSSIIPYYATLLLGDAKNPPTLKATSSFSGNGVIDADPYGNVNNPSINWWQSVNNFYKSVRNFVIDTTALADGSTLSGIHWQVAQATSLQNIKVVMPQTSTTTLIGIQSEDGSGGFIEDVVITGGNKGLSVDSQQFTISNVQISNTHIAVQQNWNWDFTYQDITVTNCNVAIYLAGTSDKTQTATGSVYLLDWTVTNTPIFVQSNLYDGSNGVTTLVDGIIIDNAVLSGVSTGAVVDTYGNVVLAGGSTTINLWIQGDVYKGTGSMTRVEKTMTSYTKPSALTSGGKVYRKSRPQYATYATSQFKNAKADGGAKGDGSTDDTTALQNFINEYWGCYILYFPAGIYIVSNTLTIPTGATVVGEYMSTIMASGSNFASQSSPTVAVRVGASGDSGAVEISNLLFSSRSPAVGAILVEWNTKGSSQGAAGLWDSHFRIGGAQGTNIQSSDCTHGSGTSTNTNCQGAYLAFHLTKSSSAYVGNSWCWAADHDIESSGQTQIDTYSGRGILVESTSGPTWLSGVASEHHTLYQFNFATTTNIFAGLLQTETPYYQPSPAVPSPFSASTTYQDPTYPSGDTSAWALFIQKSSNIIVGGAGFYSFFQDNGNTAACTAASALNCQTQIVDIDTATTNTRIYGLSTVGTTYQVSVAGVGVAKASDNIVGTTAQNVALWASSDSTLRSRLYSSEWNQKRAERLSRSRIVGRNASLG